MGSPHAMDASVYRLGEPGIQQQCSGIECVVADVLSAPLALFASLVLTVLLLVAVTYLRNARDACTEEQSRLRTERDAFERFARGVQSLSANSPQPNGAAHGGAVLAQSNAVETQAQLRQVRDLYEKTVMAVPHYEEDYGETMAQHMAAELGDDLAVAVLDGDHLTPQVQQALVQKSREASRERGNFLRTLDGETEQLEDARDAFEEIDGRVARVDGRPRLQKSFPELRDDWEELDALEDECLDVIERRQRYLKDGAATNHWREDGHSLCEYLYSPLSVQYPVLADGTLLLDRIRTTKRRVVDSLTRRV